MEHFATNFPLQGQTNGNVGDETIGYKSNETESEICFWTQFDKKKLKSMVFRACETLSGLRQKAKSYCVAAGDAVDVMHLF